MKKYLFSGVLFLLTMFAALPASAYKVTFAWDTPGSVKLRIGSMTADFVELTPDQTSYTFDSADIESSYTYVYIFPADGYILKPTVKHDGSALRPSSNPTHGQYYSMYMTENAFQGYDNPTIKLISEKLERKASLKVNITGHPEYFTGAFSDLNYQVNLGAGANTVMFDPTVDVNFLIKLDGPDKLESIKLNGTDVARNQYYAQYDLKDLKDGDVLDIVTGEIKYATLTFDLSEGLEGCIRNIRDWSASKFYYDEGEPLQIIDGHDIQINFSDEYDYTAFEINGADVTDKFTGTALRFTLDGNTTLKVTGAAKVYDEVEYTAYIMNAEGVELSSGQYGAANVTLGEGAPADTQLPSWMDASATRKYIVTATEDRPNVYIAPKNGWFIYNVVSSATDPSSQISMADPSSPVFFIKAQKLENTARMSVNINSDNTAYLSSASVAQSNWDNPGARFQVSKGENTIQFNPDYHSPFQLRVIGAEEDAVSAYIDGLAIAADENGLFVFTPCASASLTDPVYSTVDLYDGTTPRTSNVAVTCGEGIDAQVLCGTGRTAGTKAQKVLRGTIITIVPSASAAVTLDGEPLEADAEGNYVFTASGSRHDVTVEGKAPEKNLVEATLDPAPGTVRSLSSIGVIVPVESEEQMFEVDMEKAMQAAIVAADGTRYAIESMGETSPVYDDSWAVTAWKFEFIFAAATEPGEYTLEIPEGTFFEAAWDDAAEGMVPVAGGAVNAAIKAVYTVDPNAKTPVDNYVLSPAEGPVRSLKYIYIGFPEISLAQGYTMRFQEEGMSLTDGTTTYAAVIMRDDEFSDYTRFAIIPCDADYMEVEITEGDWTLDIPEGYFSWQAFSSSAITASWNVSADNPLYPISPVPGSVTGNLSRFTITFPDAASVEYNDEMAISLTGPDFSAQTTFVSRDKGANIYDIMFSAQPSADGEYVLTIPAGAFILDGETPSEAVTAKYTYRQPWVLDPTPGTTHEQINEVTISFPYAEKVEFIGDEYSFLFSVGMSYGVMNTTCTEVTGTEHPTFRIAIAGEAPQQPLGTLTFRAYPGAFSVDGVETSDIVASYTIAREVSTDYEPSPSRESVVYSDEGIYLAFIFDESARIMNNGPIPSQVKLTIGETTLTYGRDNDYEVVCENNFLMVNIYNTRGLKEGKLTFTADEGAFLLGRTPVPAIEHSWNLLPPREFVPVITPTTDAVAADLSVITISFPDATSAVIEQAQQASLAGAGYIYYQTVRIEAVEGAEHPTFNLIFEPAPVDAGKYTLRIHHGAFLFDDAYESSDIEAVFDFDKNSGIALPGIDTTGGITVVTIDGRVILLNAPVEEAASLSPGLYIINGVKVLVKK